MTEFDFARAAADPYAAAVLRARRIRSDDVRNGARRVGGWLSAALALATLRRGGPVRAGQLRAAP